MKLTKVLIVDDSEVDQFLSKIAIEEFDASIEIIEAVDGREALIMLKKFDVQPDVIFLDINMPVMDGHEFLKEYDAAGYESAVVVMLTSSEQEQDKVGSQAYQCVKKYLSKPLESSDLDVIANL